MAPKSEPNLWKWLSERHSQNETYKRTCPLAGIQYFLVAGIPGGILVGDPPWGIPHWRIPMGDSPWGIPHGDSPHRGNVGMFRGMCRERQPVTHLLLLSHLFLLSGRSGAVSRSAAKSRHIRQYKHTTSWPQGAGGLVAKAFAEFNLAGQTPVDFSFDTGRW